MIEVRPGKEKIGIDHANSGLAMSKLNKLEAKRESEDRRTQEYKERHWI